MIQKSAGIVLHIEILHHFSICFTAEWAGEVLGSSTSPSSFMMVNNFQSYRWLLMHLDKQSISRRTCDEVFPQTTIHTCTVYALLNFHRNHPSCFWELTFSDCYVNTTFGAIIILYSISVCHTIWFKWTCFHRGSKAFFFLNGNTPGYIMKMNFLCIM